MNTSAGRELWVRLQGAGLVAGEMPEATAAPWFIRGMLGIAGWIGAFFILGFVGAAFAMVMQSAGAAAVAALICSAGALAIFRAAGRSDFFAQFGLAIGFAGQILFAVAVFQWLRVDDVLAWLAFAAIEALLAWLLPNFIHRVCATFVGVISLSFGFAQAGIYGLAAPLAAAACALVWCNELRLMANAALWRPVGYGLVLGVLQTVATPLFGGDLLIAFRLGGGGWFQQYGTVVGTALVVGVFLVVTARILKDLDIALNSREGLAVLACAVLVLAVSFPAHGLAAALLILVLGFAGGNRVLFGLGLLAVAAFLGHYYYQMRETLLYKSLVLAVAGILLFGLRWGLNRLFPVREGRRHA